MSGEMEIEAEGWVTLVDNREPGSVTVRLDESDALVTCPKRRRGKQPVRGDRVRVRLSPYDVQHGRLR